MTDWLTRYRDGQRDLVWHELAEIGDVRESGRLDEAQAVCDEMARRARHNVELIVERLRGEGFLFHRNDDERTPTRPHTPPTTGAAAHAAWLEERLGPFVLPLAPDRLHKENVSGGGPYGIVLPDGRADGLFRWEETTIPFVSYLNWAFQNGGFPMAGEEDGAREITNRLAQDLLPL
ncbi:hypothetical protein ACFWN2_08855 [Lentzea sp. NPDC058436]|uniref:hypothetical protein n=1 Tax=Lentzea sp. NPDC058436 TaxID=3346499 RepID=UPI00366051CC